MKLNLSVVINKRTRIKRPNILMNSMIAGEKIGAATSR
jgi:hypothetical protein